MDKMVVICFFGRGVTVVYLYSVLAIFSAWKWGAWKNWRQYYPTMLFYIMINLLHTIITADHPQWVFHDYFVPNSTIKTLIMIFLQYPCYTILFLTHLPSAKVYLPVYFLFWTSIYSVLELLSLLTGVIHYEDGWNFGWSVILNLCTFTTLYIHYKNPLWAWILSCVVTSLLIYIFHIPITQLK